VKPLECGRIVSFFQWLVRDESLQETNRRAVRGVYSLKDKIRATLKFFEVIATAATIKSLST
jgi:hypothetical protein